MSSAAQVQANRENGKKSQGPVTEAGKQASCMNNFRHGLAGGAFYFLEQENPDVYDVLLKALLEEHHPKTPTEKLLVQKMAQSQWLAQRAIGLQTGAMVALASPFAAVDEVNKWVRYQMQHERAFQRALNQLLKLRAERRKEQIGFESLKAAQARQERAATAENRRETQHQNQQQTRNEHDKLKTQILEQRLEREKANAMTAGLNAAAVMERELGPEGMKMMAKMAA